jgi:drug/metabolite transporter (DMT)-like permease
LTSKKGRIMRTKYLNRSVAAAFMLIVFFTGFNAIAVKSSESELPPFFGAALRFGIAALILLVIMMIFRLPFPRGKSLAGAILFGVLGCGISRALLYYALAQLPAGISMVLLGLVPLLTCLLACLQKQEVFRWKSLTGSVLAMGGIVLIFKNHVQTNLPVLPLLAVIGAAACYAEAIVIIKAFPQSHPLTTNAVALTSGSLLLSIFSALWKETPTLAIQASSWESLIYLILFGTLLTFVLTIYVINHWTASASSYQFVLFPIITLVLGARMNNEVLNAALLVGGLMVLSGVYIGGILKTTQRKRTFTRLFARFKTSPLRAEEKTKAYLY